MNTSKSFNLFSPNEIDFFAEDELITIIPRITMREVIPGIAGDYGPFRPGEATTVPLWLAITLKKRHKCDIKPPAWLTASHLQAVLKLEKEYDGLASKQDLPRHYKEIAVQLLTVAPDNITNVHRVRALLQDVWHWRQMKIHEKLKVLNGGWRAYRAPNMSAMEVNAIRPFFVHAMNQYYTLSTRGDEASARAQPATTTGGEESGVVRRLPRR